MPPAPASDPRQTPAMRQHAAFKAQHPGCVLLFRIGDFYEMFDDDAVNVSRAIGLTLTQRTAGVPMAGVPHHQLHAYLRKINKAGFRIAIAEQAQDPATVKPGQIVERKVTQLITPGTLSDEALLDGDQLAAVAALAPLDARGNATPAAEPAAFAAAVAEVSTGRFVVLRGPAATMADELWRLGVCELLYPGSPTDQATPAPPWADLIWPSAGPQRPAMVCRPSWHFRHDESLTALRQQFALLTFEAFGLGDTDPEAAPAGAVLRYLVDTQSPPQPQHHPHHQPQRPDGAPSASGLPCAALAHLRPPSRLAQSDHLVLDAPTRRALEIQQTIRAWAAPDGASAPDGSLVGLFLGAPEGDAPRTPMGRRLVQEWLVRPSALPGVIAARHAAVGLLRDDAALAQQLAEALRPVQDVPRMAARVALGRASPRDLVGLARSLGCAPRVLGAIDGAPALAPLRQRLAPLAEPLGTLSQAVVNSCVSDPPAHLREGGLVRDGVDAQLDRARALQHDAAQWMVSYQARLIAEHDLPSLRVGYNKVTGYYIELPRAQAARAPAALVRRQTLASTERFVTPELLSFEHESAAAAQTALTRERAVFDSLCAAVRDRLGPAEAFSDAVAHLDALLCFARIAARRRWCRPEMTDRPVLALRQSRHPVLERLLAHQCVPNDVALGLDPASGQPAPRLALITGPNMGGKSTLVRQAALAVILAHAGSFVPAESATIGLTDRVLARVGADDALFAGRSTFMVEMTETAAILHRATERSLVVLDEIGRGTSTLDGLALAWAIAESLAGLLDPRSAAPRVIFATHYHELTQLQDRAPERVANLRVTVRELADSIVFLHQILPGRADRSYGIHVARLAGVPDVVLRRAGALLSVLAVSHGPRAAPAEPGAPEPLPDQPAAPRAQLPIPAPPAAGGAEPAGQLGLFTQYIEHPALERLRAIDLDGLSPLRAFDELRQLRQMLGDG
ncbi:MAG: DNA mismatch repair protein MutS [Planctomyces sp.]|nr:DNA mismatch repair protein MutS [Planctomyces sp.]